MNNRELKECIRNCLECVRVCQETLVFHCLLMGGKHTEQEHVKLMLDCIQICQTAADFMRRDSILHASVCRACADVCEACERSCQEIGEGMDECALICLQCAGSCREMSKMHMAA